MSRPNTVISALRAVGRLAEATIKRAGEAEDAANRRIETEVQKLKYSGRLLVAADPTDVKDATSRAERTSAHHNGYRDQKDAEESFKDKYRAPCTPGSFPPYMRH